MNLYITEIKIENNILNCYTESSIEGMTPAGRIIVDSDNFTFIYLLDNGDIFCRLHFVQETWSMLRDNKGKDIIVNDKLKLTDFWEELSDLLENIEGNNNYGQAFEEAVITTMIE